MLFEGTANMDYFKKANEKTNKIAYNVSLLKELHWKFIIVYFLQIYFSYLDKNVLFIIIVVGK